MAASAAAMTDADSFLPALTKSLSELNAQPAMPTAEFCRAMSLILPVFDHLGVFFGFAKQEMGGKVSSLEKAQAQMPTLDEVVNQCVQNGSLTTKNSPARNLHRLVSAVDFIKVLLQNLSQEPPQTLHTACADAYNKTMSGIHTFVVRTAVKAGMYTLPSRQHFLAGIGEPDNVPDSKLHAREFISVAEAVSQRATALYGTNKMPRSDSTWTG